MLSPALVTSPRPARSEVTHRAGVLGSPIRHSLSPVLHAAAYRALGLTHWEYLAADVDTASFRAHLAGLDRSWRGLSLTMPLKEAALQVASHVSEVARATAAVNTLVRDGEGWQGDNTDVVGIRRALAEAGADSPRSVVVVGSGATARSAVVAVAAMGARRVAFMVRDAARPETLDLARGCGLEVEQRGLGDWPRGADLVVSTVPGAVRDRLAASLPGRGGVLLDVVYGSGPGALVQAASGAGYAVVPGTAMLLHQAAEQVRLMTGQDPPLEPMRQALAEALSGPS